MKPLRIVLWILLGSIALDRARAQSLSYPIVDTGQIVCYDDRAMIDCPSPGDAFYGQDAQHTGLFPTYRDNRDGTISDLQTGLDWVQARGEKMTWDEAMAGATTCRVGGYDDWRLPTIKELYSLINFTGHSGRRESECLPYLDTRYFEFAFGDPAQGERIIDCQDWSATEYVGTTMDGNPTVFGVNFADGRIKGYPKIMKRREGRVTNRLYVRYVRGNPAYGKNRFRKLGADIIEDEATGLMWSRKDSGTGMQWEQALAWVAQKNREGYLGYRDWRLPNAKELQSIVDYTRNDPAVNPLFQTTRLEDGEYPFFWTSTTHLEGPPEHRGQAAVYVAFGRATGWMQIPPLRGTAQLLDVHGAGAQRSDPKAGDPADYPEGRGPQGDVIRIENFVRCVRGAL
ncbi:MAG: DUF1566 domain-containing protein [Kiritimatiellae bacterium]|nr:DUF1566 domain-containing protein [Kiritimatiellia bacterium]